MRQRSAPGPSGGTAALPVGFGHGGGGGGRNVGGNGGANVLESTDDLALRTSGGGGGSGGGGVSKLDDLEMKHDAARAEIELMRRELGL